MPEQHIKRFREIRKMNPKREKELQAESWRKYIQMIHDQNYEEKTIPSEKLMRKNCAI